MSNHINIKNIYWMLAYAFRMLEESENERLGKENFENIYDLFAAILSIGIGKQLKRGLSKEYISIIEDTKSIKGKINISESVKNYTMKNSSMICEYDEYSNDSYMNKILKTTALLLIKSQNIKKEEYRDSLKREMLYFKDIGTIDIKRINWNSMTYNGNNKTYKLLMNVCYLIINGLLISGEEGDIVFAKYIDDQTLPRLYEKFILEFYKLHYPQLNPSVMEIKWNVENEDAMIDLLPKMKTDITLTFKKKMLIIDAKFYSHIFQKNSLYDKETLHSNNLYQIFTYVKNADKYNSGDVSGMLLYAKTDETELNTEKYVMSGNNIFIDNLDLMNDFETIDKKLRKIADDFIDNYI